MIDTQEFLGYTAQFECDSIFAKIHVSKDCYYLFTATIDRLTNRLYVIDRMPDVESIDPKEWKALTKKLARHGLKLIDNFDPYDGLDKEEDPADARPVEEFMTEEERTRWQQQLREWNEYKPEK